MVSFFGLKFGGDKKKAQKQAAKDWNQLDQSTSNFSRQQARPATSHETQSPTNWRSVFRGNGDNSSMVDLSPPMPRRPSIGSIRSWNNTSTTHLPLPPFGAANRAGLPERPSTANARTREWVNPLDIHFAKDMVAPRLSEDNKSGVFKHVEISVKTSPVGDYVKATSKTDAERRATAGYPSPPSSHVGDATSPTGNDSFSLAPSHSQATLPSSLPSPALSGSRTSDEQWEPVAPRSLGKRDTTTFHTARRRSFTKETDTRPEELAKIRKTQQIEGFAGNFAAFDFGEEVRRQTTIDLPAPRLSAEDTPSVPKPLESPAKQSNRSPSPKPTLKKSPTAESETGSTLEQVRSLNLPTRKFSGERSPELQRPATSYDPSNRRPSFKDVPEGRRSSDVLDFADRGSSRSRADSDLMNSFPKPARPAVSIPTTDALRCHSPFGAPADLTGTYSVSVEGGNTKSTPKPSSPKTSFERAASPLPMKLGSLFSSAKNSLPRGRQPQAPRRPPRADEKTSFESANRPPEFSTPDWGATFNAEDPRMSAMPAPLSARPRLGSGSGSASASSPLALESPMVPDEAFQSLVLTLADVEDSFASTLDAALEKTSSYSSDFFSLSQATSATSVTRVEAKKAPPRPAPITLPPSPSKAFGGARVVTPRSATAPSLPTTFI